MTVQVAGPATGRRHHLSVAVIGAGAAGLAAGHELLREGHLVTIFEQGQRAGGVWVYTDEVEETDARGMRQGGQAVHSSMYRNLRTNLPREVMGFAEVPFTPAALGTTSIDARRYPCHEEVEAYLESVCEAWGLAPHIRWGRRVVRVRPMPAPGNHPDQRQPDSQPAGAVANGHAEANGSPTANGNGYLEHCVHGLKLYGQELGSRGAALIPAVLQPPWPRWEVTTEGAPGPRATHEFDAVVVCSGHYSEPRIPDLPGASAFPGRQMHAHNYRNAGGFAGQTVAVLGASASGEDIAREIGEVAEKVYLCARTWQNPDWATSPEPIGRRRNVWRRPSIIALEASGALRLEDGQEAEGVDTVVYATGYNYAFPFLEAANIVTIQDNRRALRLAMVAPLYHHVFPPAHAPTLAFIGLPWQVVPFPQFELQSRWVSRALSGAAPLPPRATMAASAQKFLNDLAAAGIPQRYTHRQGAEQWRYNELLAKLAAAPGVPGVPGVPAAPRWREDMFIFAGKLKRSFPETYRDAWPENDGGLVAAADKEGAVLATAGRSCESVSAASAWPGGAKLCKPLLAGQCHDAGAKAAQGADGHGALRAG